MHKKIKDNYSKIGIVILVALFVVSSLASAQTIQSQQQKNQPLIIYGDGPLEESTLYADGSTVPLETGWVAWAEPGPDFDSSKITLEEFEQYIMEGIESYTNDPNKILVGEEPRTGFDLVYSLSSPPDGAADAAAAVEAYIESLFDDPITVTIPVSWGYSSGGFLAGTYTYYANAVTWDNTRNGLQAGMDPDDSIQNWLPSGSTIPVRYTMGTTITNENRVFFSKANYKAAIGTVTGTDADIQFNTYYTWDYNPANGVSGDAICFQSVLAHETGHALGFLSGADFRTGDMEALDIFRFPRSDGGYDYNPDTLEEFQTKSRLVYLDNGAYSDDVNSDIISVEYRMSDGDPYQASHFSTSISPDQEMEPAIGYGETFYPSFYRTGDITMFDAVGWDYASESGTTTLPFSDTFPSTIINSALWTGVEGATINDLGLSEPSSPYSLDLDGSTSGGDKLRTAMIDTSALPEFSFSYYYERKGGGDQPEANDDLIIEYYNASHMWVQLDRFLGSGSAMTTYTQVQHTITPQTNPDAFHTDFRVQFRVVSSQSGLDDWFVDNVNINKVYYTLTTSVIGSGSILKEPDYTSYESGSTVIVTAQPAQDWSFLEWQGDLSGDDNPETILMNSNKAITAVFTLDDIVPPQWRSQGQNKTLVPPGDSIKLYAQGSDDRSLDRAYLSTNESGTWQAFDGGGWWNLAWGYSKRIVIDHTQVPSDLAEFPVCIAVTSTDFTAHAQTDADDFVFVANVNTTQLPHEIEYYNSGTGELVAWVNIPVLSSTQDTIIYVYYGNPSCTSQQNVGDTWNDEYITVHHMTGSAYTALDDSSNSGWDVTSMGGNPVFNQIGKIGRCVDFDGTGDYLKLADFRLPTDASYTAGAWVYVDGSSGTRRYLFEGDADAGISLTVWTNETYKARTHTSDAWPVSYSTTTATIGSPQWHYVCTRLDPVSDLIYIMVNGVAEDSTSITGTVNAETAGLNIATDMNNANYWMNGRIDEVRVSNVVRSDDWVFTEYNNMVSPSTFAVIGPEIAQGGGSGYGSPTDLNTAPGEWVWTNYTWVNPSIPAGTVVGWKITYVDAWGNTVNTGVMDFTVGTPSGYTLTINIFGEGQVLKDPDQMFYDPGTPVELTAMADPGWHFDEWNGDLQGSENPETIIMDSDKVVNVYFVEDQYTLTVNVNGNGYVTKNPDQPTYTYGTSVQLHAYADLGWHFDHWTGNVANQYANPTTITMYQNEVVTAYFVQDQYILNINIDGLGQVLKNPDQETYTYGTPVELTAIADPGWDFTLWSGDLEGSENPDTIIMTRNMDVTAHFTQNLFQLTGDCYYPGMSPVNDVTVEIINQNTGERWQAETVDNHYTLAVEPGVDVSAGDTIRYIARDTDESVNVTDHVVTSQEISSGGLTLDLILDVHYRDLRSFPFYLSGVDTGAAIMRMEMDYLTWNSSIDPLGPPAVYDEQTLFDTYAGGDYFTGDELAQGLNAEIRPTDPNFAYFFAPYGYTNANDALKSACIWIDYNVSYYNEYRENPVPQEGFPFNVPVAIPTQQDYNHWMVIRGIHTDRNLWEYVGGHWQITTEPVIIKGFWLNDPSPSGLGGNTYLTAEYLTSNYFKLLSNVAPADPYYNKYLVITDPPQGVPDVDVSSADVSIADTPSGFTAGQARLIQLAKNTVGLQPQASSIIIKTAWNAANDVLLNDADYADVFAHATTLKKPQYIGNECVVLFGYHDIVFEVHVLQKTGELLRITIQ